MLKERVITGFALLFLILGAVFGLSETAFSLFIATVILLGVWEWTSLMGLTSIVSRVSYLVLLCLVMTGIVAGDLPVKVTLLAGLLWWAIAFMLVSFYPGIKRVWANSVSLGVFGIFLFLPGMQAFIFLRSQEYHTFLLLQFLAMVAAADIGAYFTGRAFGSRKLAPRVSPNKTWEGFFGGMFACCALLILATILFVDESVGFDLAAWLILAACGVIIASLSVLGDLFESMVKRFREVKDSGTILPGHGGILDRIDGITAAAPVYALLVMLLERELL